jgi:nucleotide-binding universal stress UspA family protein
MTGEVPSGSVTVGVDDSEASHRALRWAVREAVLAERPLCILHAYDPHPAVYSGIGATFPAVELDAALDKAAEEVLHQARHLAREQAPHLPVTLVWSTLDPREALVESGRSAELLVVASRGRGTMAHLLLGSVGFWVSQHAPCPVVVFRGEPEDEERRWIVVGSDGTPASEAALEFGLTEAGRHGARVTVVQCVPTEVGGAHRAQDGPVTEDRPERHALEEAVAKAAVRHPGVKVDCELRRGSAAGHLTRVSEGASMVVLGSKPRHGPRPWGLGGVRRAVVEHAACTVAVVPGSVGSGD